MALYFLMGTVRKKNIRTAPSVIQEARQGTTDPAIHYKEKLAGGMVPAALEATLKPRNP